MPIDLLPPEERNFWCQDSKGEICETVLGPTVVGCTGGGCVLVDKGGDLTQYIVPASFDGNIVGQTATLRLRVRMDLSRPVAGFTSDTIMIGLGDELVRETISLEWQQFSRNFVLPQPRDGRIGVYLRSNNEASHPNYPVYSIYMDEIRLTVEGTTSGGGGNGGGGGGGSGSASPSSTSNDSPSSPSSSSGSNGNENSNSSSSGDTGSSASGSSNTAGPSGSPTSGGNSNPAPLVTGTSPSGTSEANIGPNANIGTEGGNGGVGGPSKAGIVGGVIGGIAVLILVSGLMWLFLIRKKRRSKELENGVNSPFRPSGSMTKLPLSTLNTRQDMVEVPPSSVVVPTASVAPSQSSYSRDPGSLTTPIRFSTETESTANGSNRPSSIHKPRAPFANFSQGRTASPNLPTSPPAHVLVAPASRSSVHTIPEHNDDLFTSQSNALPSYAMAVNNAPSARTTIAITNPPNPFSTDSSLLSSAYPAHNDALAMWAEANRHWITPSLESKLRAASYHPDDDPETIDADTWKNEYRVTAFELRRLKELYARIGT